MSFSSPSITGLVRLKKQSYSIKLNIYFMKLETSSIFVIILVVLIIHWISYISNFVWFFHLQCCAPSVVATKIIMKHKFTTNFILFPFFISKRVQDWSLWFAWNKSSTEIFPTIFSIHIQFVCNFVMFVWR